MSKVRLIASLALVASAGSVGAQSTAEYQHRVDSLAAIWRPLVAANAARKIDSAKHAVLPPDSVSVAPIVVRADTQYAELARTVAEKLAPRVNRAYGAFANVLGQYRFVIRALVKRNGYETVATGVAYPTGDFRLPANVTADAGALENSWTQKIEEVMTDALDPSVREWLGTRIPMAPQSRDDWSQARVDLLLASSEVARRCALENGSACMLALGVRPSADPAFEWYSDAQRRELIEHNSGILKRATPKQFDQCVTGRVAAACESLVRSIPNDVIPTPVPPRVRQSLVRFALETGGEGAFDRFNKPGTIADRLQAASQLPADTVVARWRAKLLDARTSSTALDSTTALSSLFWVTLCACLALRSSRWR